MANKDNLRLWVAALRSGEYTQGKGTLHNAADRTWCCLGVACDVFRKNGGGELVTEVEVEVEVAWYDGGCQYLPARVMDWLGVDSDNPFFDGYRATYWNDEFHVTFNRIADAIDKEYRLSQEDAPVG